MIPACVPTKSRLVFEGSYDERCQAKRFLDSSDCVEVFDSSNPPLKPKKDLFVRAFWYPENATASDSRPSLQQKIKAFLLILGTCLGMYGSVMRGDFVQLWTPIATEDGRVVLSVAKQPFGARRFSKGLCRYRYYSLDCCSTGSRTEVGCDFGPVGKAFTTGSPEFCPHMDAYHEVNIRLKNQVTQHFKHCGIVGYLALPLFEQGGLSCFGVLEFVSTYDYYFSSSHTRGLLETLKEVGLEFRYPSDSELLTQIRPYFNFPVPVDARKAKFDEIRSVLDLVRKMYSLPLIQVWLPCICNGSKVSIACDPNSSSFAKATHLVCGLQCFDKDEWQPTGNFRYDPQVRFVEDGESWVGRAHAQKKICFIKNVRKSNIRDYPRVSFSDPSNDPILSACFAIPLQLVHPKLPPLVLEVLLPSQYNYHANHGAILNPILFVLSRELSKYNAEFGLNKGDKYFLKTSQPEDGYDCVYFDVDRHHDASESQHLTVATKENMRPCPSHESIGGRSTLKRKLPIRRSLGLGRSPSRPRNDVLPVQQTPEFSTISVYSSGDDRQSGMSYSPSDTSKERESEAARVSISISGRESVFEPRNNEVSHGASIPSTNEKGKNFVAENDEVDPVKVVNTVLESLEADNSCTMIVKARYKDEIVKFPFSSNSGIQGLQRDLLKRFEVEAQRIKIKYRDDGEWITLACSEDLGFHMHTLKSSGQTTLDLSVFPVT